MDTQKLKIKIGEHEFEAEGPVEVVQAQFAAFKELIASATTVSRKAQEQKSEPAQPAANGSSQVLLERIVRVDGRIISLTARTGSIADAIILILYAQKILRNNETVTSTEVVDGLKTSGHMVTRVDSTMRKLEAEGLVIKIGQRRATQYRLTNQGVTRAQEIARGVIALAA
ncbi:MAG TPA: hypothetical protein VEJ46_17065 [Candidatus Acidoferrum sp.]|nr:hypothetical protein [Candidatus Acidoferrum sp.]